MTLSRGSAPSVPKGNTLTSRAARSVCPAGPVPFLTRTEQRAARSAPSDLFRRRRARSVAISARRAHGRGGKEPRSASCARRASTPQRLGRPRETCAKRALLERPLACWGQLIVRSARVALGASSAAPEVRAAATARRERGQETAHRSARLVRRGKRTLSGARRARTSAKSASRAASSEISSEPTAGAGRSKCRRVSPAE